MKKKIITALTLCLLCFVMLICFAKLDTHPNPNGYVSHKNVYAIGLNKLKNSIPSEEGLTIQGHRIQYNKEADAFVITFDYIGLNHQGFMTKDSKSFQVTSEELK